MPSDAIPLSVPSLAGREAEYVAECISGGWVSAVGPFVERFERQAAASVDANRGVATASGTAALHLALLVGGVEPGDAVLLSNLTFIAPANAIRYAGAFPIFFGSEPRYWQIDPARVRAFLEEECELREGVTFHRQSGRRVRAIIAVHALGHPADMASLTALAKAFGLVVIEDCAEAIGARLAARHVGSFGDIAAFSFNGNKVVTCGGGGLLVSRHPEWLDRARHLSTQAKSDPREYIHDVIGYNYRMTSLQAAVGCAQLEQLEGFLQRKRAIAECYREAFRGVGGLLFMQDASDAAPTYWLCTIRVDPVGFRIDSRGLMRRLEEQGIQSRPLWQPLHLSPAHRDAFHRGCEGDEMLWREALSLPSSPSLTEDDQARVISAVLGAKST